MVTTAASLTWNALSGALSPRNALGAPPPHVNLTDSLVLRTSLGKGFILIKEMVGCGVSKLDQALDQRFLAGS